jgi:hypothetical protein
MGADFALQNRCLADFAKQNQMGDTGGTVSARLQIRRFSRRKEDSGYVRVPAQSR